MSEEKKGLRLKRNFVIQKAQKLFDRKQDESAGKYEKIYKDYQQKEQKHDKALEQHKKHIEKEQKALQKEHQEALSGLEQSLTTQQKVFAQERERSLARLDEKKTLIEASFEQTLSPLEKEISQLDAALLKRQQKITEVEHSEDDPTQENKIAKIIIESQKPLREELNRLLNRLKKTHTYDENELTQRLRFVDKELTTLTNREKEGIEAKIQSLQHELEEHQEHYVSNFERLEYIMLEGTKTFDSIADLLLNYQSAHQQHHKPVFDLRQKFTKEALKQNKQARQDVLKLLNSEAHKTISTTEKQFFLDYIQFYESLDQQRTTMYKSIDALTLKILQQIDSEMARIYDTLDQQIFKQKKLWQESSQAFFDALKIYRLDVIDTSLAHKLLLSHLKEGLSDFFEQFLSCFNDFQQKRHQLLEDTHHKAQSLYDALDEQQLFLDAYYQKKQHAFIKAKQILDIQSEQLSLGVEKLKIEHEKQLYDIDKEIKLKALEHDYALEINEIDRKEAVAKIKNTHHKTLEKHQLDMALSSINYASKKGILSLEIDLWKDKKSVLEAEVNEKADRLMQDIKRREARALKDLSEQNDMQYDAHNLTIQNLQQQIKQTTTDQEDLIKEIRHEALDDVKGQYDSIYSQYHSILEQIESLEAQKSQKSSRLDEVYQKETAEARNYINAKKAVLSTRLHELDVSYKDLLNQISDDRQTLVSERHDIKVLLTLCSQEHFQIFEKSFKNIINDAIDANHYVLQSQLEDNLSHQSFKNKDSQLKQKHDKYVEKAKQHQTSVLSSLEKAYDQTRKKIRAKGRENLSAIRALLEQLVSLQEQTLKTETTRIMDEMKANFNALIVESEAFVEATKKRADKLKEKTLSSLDKELKKYQNEEQTLKRTIDKIESKILKKAKVVAQSKLDHYEQRIAELEVKIKQSEQERDALQKVFEKEEQALKDQYDTELANVEHQRIKDIENTLESHRQHLSLLEQRLTEALEVLDQFETSKQDTIAFEKKQHQKTLQESENMFKDQQANLDKKFDALQQNLIKNKEQMKETLQQELKKVNDEILGYTRKLEQIESDIDKTFENKKQHALEEKARLKKALKNLNEEAYDQVIHLIEELHLSIQKLFNTTAVHDLSTHLDEAVKEHYKKQHDAIDQFIKQTVDTFVDELKKEDYDGE